MLPEEFFQHPSLFYSTTFVKSNKQDCAKVRPTSLTGAAVFCVHITAGIQTFCVQNLQPFVIRL